MPRPALKRSRPPPDITTGLADVTTNRYFINKVIDCKLVDDQLYFLVKWADWPSKYNTWEPLHHMNHCTNLIDLFFEKRPTDRDSGSDKMELERIYMERKPKRLSDVALLDNSKRIPKKKKSTQ